jgi:site-specific DNA-cytosine methylase
MSSPESDSRDTQEGTSPQKVAVPEEWEHVDVELIPLFKTTLEWDTTGPLPRRSSQSGGDIANVCRLTVRECARIQTFLDEYMFAGTRGEQYRIVCNAVPPALVHHIGHHLRTEALETQTDSASVNEPASQPNATEIV